MKPYSLFSLLFVNDLLPPPSSCINKQKSVCIFGAFSPLVFIIKGYYSNRSYLWNGSPSAPSVQIFVYAWLPLWLFLIVLGQPWQTMVTLNKQAGSLGPARKEWYQGSQFDFPWLITLFIWNNLLCTVPACLAKQITPSTGKDLELLINKEKQGRQVRLTQLQIEAAGFRSMIRAVYLFS